MYMTVHVVVPKLCQMTDRVLVAGIQRHGCWVTKFPDTAGDSPVQR